MKQESIDLIKSAIQKDMGFKKTSSQAYVLRAEESDHYADEFVRKYSLGTYTVNPINEKEKSYLLGIFTEEEKLRIDIYELRHKGQTIFKKAKATQVLDKTEKSAIIQKYMPNLYATYQKIYSQKTSITEEAFSDPHKGISQR